MANAVVHFEIPSRSAKMRKMIRFYEDMFGWKVQSFPKMKYWTAWTDKTNSKTGMLAKKNRINGGFTKRRMEKGPVIYLEVKNVKSHLKKIEARGGKIVTPFTPIPGMGGFARFTDLDGNLMGLYQGK